MAPVQKFWDDNLPFNSSEYADQLIETRIRDGLAVDRSTFRSPIESFDPDSWHESSWSSIYCIVRRGWTTRRHINKMLVDNKTVSEQINELVCPVLADMLCKETPTVKAWKQFSKKDKQIQRNKKRFPRLIQYDKDPKIIHEFHDGSTNSFYQLPHRFERDVNLNDRRVERFTTPYSATPNLTRHYFDSLSFMDAAYVTRQKQFWHEALRVLSSLMSGGIRPEKEWLVYHIINNDIAAHVIFDNLSMECEMNWFSNSKHSNNKRIQISQVCDGIPLIGPKPYEFSKRDADDAIRELYIAYDKTNISDMQENLSSPFRICESKIIARVEEMILEVARRFLELGHYDGYETVCDSLVHYKRKNSLN